jgi:hypothetical protein
MYAHFHAHAHASRPCNGKTHRMCHWMQRCSKPFECFVFICRVTTYTHQSARYDSFPQEPNESRCIVETVCVCECCSKHLFRKQSPLCPTARVKVFWRASLQRKQLLHRYGLRSSKLIAANWRCRYRASLRAVRSEDRIPVGKKLSVPLQNCTGAHPVTCAMGNGTLSCG